MTMRAFVHVAAAAALVLAASAAAGAEARRDRPAADQDTVLLLRLDGDARDAGGCGNDARPRGGELTWAPGRFGKALSLAGKAGLVAPPSGSLHVGERSWTIECWLKPAGPSADTMDILSGCGAGYWLRLTPGGKRLVGMFSGAARRAHVRSGEIGRRLFDGQWHRVALVLDREHGGSMRLYLDGEEVTAEPRYQYFAMGRDERTGSACVGAVAPWYIGGKQAYRGLIDEVHVSRVVRPAYRSIPKLPLKPETTFIATPRFVTEHHVRKAAELLQTYLRKACRVEKGFEIAAEQKLGDISGKAVLALDRTLWGRREDMTGISRDGFRVRRVGNVVVIRGGKSWGTFYGAVRFLDACCGVRFYMPGELFTHLPAGREIDLGEVDITENPAVRGCAVTGLYNTPAAGVWADRNGLLRRRFLVPGEHSMYAMLPPERFAERWPEIYPILRGKRHVPADGRDQRWQPCLSEPRLVDAAVASAVRTFRKNPQLDNVTFAVMDSHDFCQCPRCLKAVEAAGGDRTAAYSRMMHAFVNAVARRLREELPRHGAAPGKIVGYSAYSDIRGLPDRPLEKNVMVKLVFKYSDVVIDKRFEPGPDGLNYIERWAGRASLLAHHDWGQGTGFLIPRFYTKLIARTLRAAKGRFVYQHVECYPNWGLDGPRYYVTARLLWDPSQDVEAIFRRLCDDLFGPAGEAMFQYFTALEDLYAQMNGKIEQKIGRYERQFLRDAEDRAAFRRCRALLDRAAAGARSKEQKRRVELFSKTFRLTELLLALAAAETVDAAQAEKVRTYAAEVLLPDPLTIFRESHRPDKGKARFLATIESAIRKIAAAKAKRPGR